MVCEEILLISFLFFDCGCKSYCSTTAGYCSATAPHPLLQSLDFPTPHPTRLRPRAPCGAGQLPTIFVQGLLPVMDWFVAEIQLGLGRSGRRCLNRRQRSSVGSVGAEEVRVRPGAPRGVDRSPRDPVWCRRPWATRAVDRVQCASSPSSLHPATSHKLRQLRPCPSRLVSFVLAGNNELDLGSHGHSCFFLDRKQTHRRAVFF